MSQGTFFRYENARQSKGLFRHNLRVDLMNKDLKIAALKGLNSIGL